MKNAINWFEIPSRNLDKSVPFYEKTLGLTLKRETFGGVPHAVFPVDSIDNPQAVSGALVSNGTSTPGPSGALIYLNAPDGVDACLARAAASGGTIVMPTTDISPHGYCGVLKDVEGNYVGIHSMDKR
jgi:predicted enzyme related to lactoylglutathione lyase